MTNGWIESDVEPPHRDDVAQDAFLAECQGCEHRMEPIEIEPTSGLTYVRCAVCVCPLKIVVHRYGVCRAGRVSDPVAEK
jgi:hypothetical protein